MSKFEVSSIFKQTTAEAPFYDLMTYPHDVNHVKYPAPSPTTIFPLLITAREVGSAGK
jgi:hypothetical protein